MLKYGFCNKSFRKDELLTSWTLFSTYLSSKLDSPSPMFWLEENLILSNVLIRGESNFDDKYVEKSVQKVFNWSEFHLSEMTCYKIHTLDKRLKNYLEPAFSRQQLVWNWGRQRPLVWDILYWRRKMPWPLEPRRSLSFWLLESGRWQNPGQKQ